MCKITGSSLARMSCNNKTESYYNSQKMSFFGLIVKKRKFYVLNYLSVT